MTKKFYSICSAHQVYDKECPLCKSGHWVDERDTKGDIKGDYKMVIGWKKTLEEYGREWEGEIKMDCKQAKEIVKGNYPPENYTMLRKALDWLIEQAEKVERYEMMYENTGAIFNRQHMRGKIEQYEEKINKINELIEENTKMDAEDILDEIEKLIRQ